MPPGRTGTVRKVASAARLLLRRFERHSWARVDARVALETLGARRFALVVANDVDTLPLALRLARGGKVILDAHEYAPREFEDRLVFRLLLAPWRRWLCRTYIPRVDAMMTVCDGIADAYHRDTGVRAEVVWNAADPEDLTPSPVLRPGPVRLVHHGAALRGRRIETMIEMTDHLDDRFELSLVLVESDSGYAEKLRRLAARRPRVRIEPPVPMRELPRFLNRFDVGVYILEPSSFNNFLALPNKFFEFVQARLAVAVGPSPEMAALVRRHGLGVVAADFDPRSLAGRLRDLGPEAIEAYKRAAHRAAPTLSSRACGERVLALAERVISGRSA